MPPLKRKTVTIFNIYDCLVFLFPLSLEQEQFISRNTYLFIMSLFVLKKNKKHCFALCWVSPPCFKRIFLFHRSFVFVRP
jgi:hypothetical protein